MSEEIFKRFSSVWIIEFNCCRHLNRSRVCFVNILALFHRLQVPNCYLVCSLKNEIDPSAGVRHSFESTWYRIRKQPFARRLDEFESQSWRPDMTTTSTLACDSKKSHERSQQTNNVAIFSFWIKYMNELPSQFVSFGSPALLLYTFSRIDEPKLTKIRFYLDSD